MRRSRKPIVIASRQSRLARTQAELVGKVLGKLHPALSIEYRWIESDGDRATGPLADAGGKGLFTRTIEQAVLDGQADIAVHSLKDLPAAAAEQTAGLAIAAIPKRGAIHDCLIAAAGVTTLDALAQGAVVGTSSPRRAAQLLRARPDLRIEPLRGNVNTRLAKVLDTDDARYDATLLAAAGLRRLGMKDLAQQTIDPDTMLPAACQGALAIQCRADDHVALTRLLPLNDAATATAAHAERQLVAALGADCHSSIAALAQPVAPEQTVTKRNADAHWFSLRARVLSPDGRQILEAREQVKTPELRRLIKQMARDLIARGARDLLTPPPASGSFPRATDADRSPGSPPPLTSPPKTATPPMATS